MAQEKPASIEPNHVYDQRDPDIVVQETDSEISYVHTLTHSMGTPQAKMSVSDRKVQDTLIKPALNSPRFRVTEL